MASMTHTIEREDGEVELTVEYEIEGGCPGATDADGRQAEADWLPFVMVEKWTPDLELTQAEIDEIEEAAYDHAFTDDRDYDDRPFDPDYE